MRSTPAGDFVRSLSSPSPRGDDEPKEEEPEEGVSSGVLPRRRQRRLDAQTRLYRDVISEHAAFGDDKALAHLGRELLLKQLRDYHRRRA